MEMSWGHNDPICHILNKSLQDETKKKALVMLHQYWKQPSLVLAVAGETAPLFEVSWYPLWYSLHREWWPRKACCTSLMLAHPFLPTEWQLLSDSAAPLPAMAKSVSWQKVRLLFWVFFPLISVLFSLEFPFLYFHWNFLKPESWPKSHVHSELIEICTRKCSGKDREQQNLSKMTIKERHKSQTRIERWDFWVPNTSSREIFW